MARTITSAPEGAVLPAALSEFLKRRAAELCGFSLIALAFANIAALISFSANDPSLNNATDLVAKNYLGYYGAIAADISLQTIGVCAAIPALLLFAWGLRLARKTPVDSVVVRLIALVIATMLGTIAVSSMSPPGNWPLVTGLGGFAGSALFAQIAHYAAVIHPVYGAPLVASLAGGASVALIIYALGWAWQDWVGVV